MIEYFWIAHILFRRCLIFHKLPIELKLLMVWIVTGSSGLVLTLGSDWMGASGFCTRMV